MAGNTAILLAGGSGSRMRGTVKDKVLEPLSGLPVILHSYVSFEKSGCVDSAIFVCRDEPQMESIKKALRRFCKDSKLEVRFAFGGKERSDSVLNGLKEIKDKSGLVFIHDGARPFVGVENIKKLAETAARDGSAILATRVSDTIKRIPKSAKSLSKCKLDDLDRSRLFAMQTPQVFIAKDILKAYRAVKRNKLKVTDDAAAAGLSGIKVSIVENLFPNIKITRPEDLTYAEYLMERLSK